MRYLTLGEILELHRRIVETSGGADGIRDLGALESAVAQPKATFDAMDLYPSLADDATTDEQEQPMLDLAAGRVKRHQLATWLTEHLKPRDDSQAV